MDGRGLHGIRRRSRHNSRLRFSTLIEDVAALRTLVGVRQYQRFAAGAGSNDRRHISPHLGCLVNLSRQTLTETISRQFFNKLGWKGLRVAPSPLGSAIAFCSGRNYAIAHPLRSVFWQGWKSLKKKRRNSFGNNVCSTIKVACPLKCTRQTAAFYRFLHRWWSGLQQNASVWKNCYHHSS